MSDVRIEQESSKDLTISVKKPHLRYLDEFMRLKCAPDLLPFFPNAKEITESFAAYSAIRQISYNVEWLDLGDPGVHLWSLCDGHQPRTAATFAYRSAWQCHSVDPQLRNTEFGTHLHMIYPKVDRLLGFSSKFSDPSVVDCFNRSLNEASAVVVAMVHPHIRLREVRGAFRDMVIRNQVGERFGYPPVVVVHIPCCVGENDILWYGPVKKYDDWGIHSPKRTVRIFYPPWMRIR